MSPDEKKYLRILVEKELAHFNKDKKSVILDSDSSFLKAGHDYKHFLEQLLKKLS